MTAVFLALTACIGYLFCETTTVVRYWLARKAGQKYYLPILLFGFAFSIFGFIVHAVVINNKIFQATYSPEWSEYLFIFLFSAAITLVIANIVNGFYGKERALMLVANNDLDKLILEACQCDQLVQVVLKSNKVYVGHVYGALEPNLENSHLTLIPLHSGHRNSEQVLLLTHTYDEIDSVVMSGDHEKYSEYRLVIPKSEIVTCAIFHVDIYNQVLKSRQRDIETSDPINNKEKVES